MIKRFFGWIKRKFCDHKFYLEDLKRNGPEFEDTNQRVIWPCGKCGKVFTAHCGLDITPKYGYMGRRDSAWISK